MTDTRVADVIRALTSDLRPVAPLPPVSRRLVGWWFLVMFAAALGVLWLGPRGDVARALRGPILVFQLVLLGTTAWLAGLSALRLAVPGADRPTVRLGATGLLAAWPLGLLAAHLLSGGTGSALATEPLHPACGRAIVGIALVPGLVLVGMVRQGATLMPAWSATMAGLAASAAGGWAVSMICPIDRAAHLLVAHAVPAWAFIALTALVARSLVTSTRPPMALLLALALTLASAGVVQAADGDGPATPPSFSVSATTGGYLGSDPMLEFLARAEAGAPTTSPFAGQGPVLVGLAILAGGILLNLTPCVLPMIPINLAIIGAGRSAVSRQRGFVLGGAYGAAMALVYGVLGGLIVATAGTFGSINASPWFNVAIALLFIGLALAMFDVVTVDLSRWSSRVPAGRAQRGSIALALGMGGVAALLAGACVAPVVIQVVAFASERHAAGSTWALALPLVLGVGMGLPWPLAGAGLAALPRPGAWMVRVKQGLGIAILMMAAWYGYEALRLFRPSTPPGAASDGWYHSLEEGLAEARRQDKPVFVDVWATWCKNCVVMDATTFRDPKVRAALDGFVKVRVQAEDVDAPDTSALLDRLDSVGLPTYAVLRPAGRRGAD